MLELIIKVVIISLSGAFAPGPLTITTAYYGIKKGWRAGLLVSLGHMASEFPLVLLIALGLINFLKSERLAFFLGIFGSLFLFIFGFFTLKDAFTYQPTKNRQEKSPSPLLTGITLSVFNPYFLIWWLGIGTPLIYEALKKSHFLGVIILYIFHVSLDYFWLIAVASLANLATTKVYRYLLVMLGITIIFFGMKMLFLTIFSY